MSCKKKQTNTWNITEQQLNKNIETVSRDTEHNFTLNWAPQTHFQVSIGILLGGFLLLLLLLLLGVG